MSAPITRRGVLPILAAAGSAFLSPAAAFAVGPMGGVPADRVAALARGFNLPDMVPATARRPNLPATLDALRRDGFTHVRLPLRSDSVIPRFAAPAVTAEALDDLDAALDLLLGRGFAVSVDMHGGDGLAGLYRRDPAAALAALTEGWAVLARRIRPRPPSRVFAELLNEPPTSDDLWRPQAEALAASVRSTLPETTLLVGPAPFERVEALTSWRPLVDRNVVYVCHYYDPMDFTHQGADWGAASPYRYLAAVRFPARLSDAPVQRILAGLRRDGHADVARSFEEALAEPWSVERVQGQFAPVGDWARRHGVPVLLNEFGVLRGKAPTADRLLWLAVVRRAAEANGIGWTVWDFDQGFALVVDGRPDPGVVEALRGR